MGDKNKINNPAGLGETLANNIGEQFGGIFSVKPMAKYLSGARCVLRMNGKIVGFAFGISWTIATEAVEINTIDDYMPYELAPSRISVSGQIQGFRIPGSGPGQALLQTDSLNFLYQRYIEIEVRDSQTNNLIFLTKRALVTSRTENVRSDALSEMTLNFKAIGFADERPPERMSNSQLNGQISDGTVDPIKSIGDKASKLLSDAKKSIGNLFS